MQSNNGGKFGWFQPNAVAIVTGLAIVAAVLTPIWYVDHFFGSDGPPHLHSASIIVKQLLHGEMSDFYRINPVVVPNYLGHLLLSGFLLVFSAGTASKLIVSVTFVAYVAAVICLRRAAKGPANIALTTLYAGALGLNRIWLVGMYNFVLGAAITIFAFGLVVRWNGEFTKKRAVMLFLCFGAAYLSHLVAFAILVCLISVFLVFRWGRQCGRPLLWISAALAPVLPFVVIYQLENLRQGTFRPQWFLLSGPFDLSGLLAYLRATDPFFILGRRYLPFSGSEAWYNVLTAPVLWIVISIVFLIAVSFYVTRSERFDATSRGVIAVTVVMAILSLASPDLLGETEGSIIRPRIMLICMPLVLAVVPFPASKIAKAAAGTLMVCVFVLQTAGLWEYAVRYDGEIEEFLPVISQLQSKDRFASVMVFDEQMRFHPSPMERIGSLAGVNKVDSIVWDTYEAGYYFFPIIAVKEVDRDAVRLYTQSNVIRPVFLDENFDRVVQIFGERLDADHGRIDVMMVRGRNARIDHEVQRWFGPGPFYETENFRLFRRRTVQ